MTTDKDYRLPDTGMVYDPHKRERRMQFRDMVAGDSNRRDAMEWFTQTGRFAKSGKAHHPAVIREGENGFIDSLRRGYQEWGSLTDKQFAAMFRSYCEVDPLVLNVGPEMSKRTLEAVGEFFGEVGERHTANLTVFRSIPIRSKGTTETLSYINLLDHTGGYRLVLSSGVGFTPGQKIKARFRIVHQDVHKGTRQTHIGDFNILNTRKPRRVGNATSDHG